jgi:integrase
MSQKRIVFISFDEFRKVFKAEKDRKFKLAYLLAFGSGLRISEIIGLEKEISSCCKADITRERKRSDGRTLKLMFCSKCKKQLTLKEVRRKSKDWKIEPLTKEMVNLPEHKINLTMAKGNKWRTTITPPNLTESLIQLLPLKIPRRTLQRRFTNLSKKVLGKKMSFHTLRHGFGNYQANVLKVPLPIVQSLMGHSRLDTTGIYTKANPEYAIKESWKAMTRET